MTSSPSGALPVFGREEPGREYLDHLAAYALLLSAEGQIAVVEADECLFLPGGGVWPDETPAQALRREAREELAWDIRVTAPLGEALQFFAVGEVSFRMHAVFFRAERVAELPGPGEHPPIWLPLAEARRRLYHACHAWAVAQLAGGNAGEDPDSSHVEGD